MTDLEDERPTDKPGTPTQALLGRDERLRGNTNLQPNFISTVMRLPPLPAVITRQAGSDTGCDSPAMSSSQLQAASVSSVLSCAAK